jgi:two-component system invasion response regulator UvrY
MTHENEKKIKVIIVDDHALFRTVMKNSFKSDFPDIEIVGEADSSKALFDILDFQTADLVLLDIIMPDMNGVEIAQKLRRCHPKIKILVISSENSSETIKTLVNLGIEGFISKQNANDKELYDAIIAVMNGMEYFGRDIASILYKVYVTKKKTTDVTAEFTKREKEIILLCRDGLISKEIADRLGISRNTVNTIKQHIFKKLDINNSMEMVQYAMKHGIIE